MVLDRDWQIRHAAISAILALAQAGNGVVTAAELDAGFEFEGERIALWSSRKGIWRPRQLNTLGAALTLVTAPRVQGRTPVYDDEVAADDRGWFGYRYEGTDPRTWTNVAVRRAMELRRPVIYLYGISKGVYEPICPSYIVADNPEMLTFRIEADVSPRVMDLTEELVYGAAPRREYQTIAVKHRIHQHRFRDLVLTAYRKRCAMCDLKHMPLLDAAHIIPDHDDRGLPEVSNGLSLCKIHHTAYDVNILGISPDYVVHVREEILHEIDGPMLEHGLKGMAGRRIFVPRADQLQPKRDYLDERYRQFLAA